MLSKVITISQQKGGTGKTTLAVHLAMAFIKYHNLKVAIIDTDPQGSLGKWFMICLLYTSPSPRDGLLSRMTSSA